MVGHKWVLGGCILAIVALSGCGGSDEGGSGAEAPAVESLDDSASDAGSDVGFDAAGGEGQAADLGDFPIPAPPGAVVGTTTAAEGITVVTVTLPWSAFDSAVAFYDDWTGSETDEYQRIVADAGGVTWLRTSGPDDRSRVIAVSAAFEDDDLVVVALTDGTIG